MKKWKIAGVWLILFFSFSAVFASSFAGAQSANSDMSHYRSLLQQGLTLHEMEQELSRIQGKQIALQEQITQLESDIDQLHITINDLHASSGEVLRRYYMGVHFDWVFMLLEARSLTDLLSLLDLLQMLISSDWRLIENYQQSLTKEKDLLAALEQQQLAWNELSEAYSAEYARLKQAEAKYEQELAASAEADAVNAQVSALIHAWETEGLPQFREYLRLLAGSINALPQWLMQDPGSLSFENNMIVLHLTDDRLNNYLREQNPIFENFNFHFNDSNIIVSGGTYEDEFQLKGRYSSELDGSPPKIAFIIDELAYQDYVLPQSTIDALQEQFDLNLYPEKLSALLVLKSFTHSDGKMSFYLGF